MKKMTFKKCDKCGEYLINCGKFYLHPVSECEESIADGFDITQEDFQYLQRKYGIPDWDYQKLLLTNSIKNWFKRLFKR